MATQGVLSVRRNGQVVLKCIAGIDGGKAYKLADQLLDLMQDAGWELPSLQDVYALALSVGFGTAEDLVVMNRRDVYHETGGPLPVPYRHTFNRSRFNPRWKDGTAGHVVVINI